MVDQLFFTKMQGVGNDFVVIDGRKYGHLDWSALAVEMCDRRRGIGADGLLVLDTSSQADVMMRMFNPDGTPDVCGNGLRCVARYAVAKGLITRDTLSVMTLAGVRPAQIRRNAAGDIVAVTVGMGLPRFDPPSIPMRVPLERVFDYPLELDAEHCLRITALSTGSTHAVTFVDALPDDAPFFEISPLVERHPAFPERTSLMWCHVINSERIEMRIWERGAGETWGCGTGACAAAVAAVLHGYAQPGEPVTIASRGGELHICWRDGDPIEMTGPAEFVYEGLYDLN
ncbi:MAG TPA: diaminopimelate epimerase [Chthonomonadaceae bacterium]|nr:diaminopimelate epimerase [Chthonomonadaceae bacterium]